MSFLFRSWRAACGACLLAAASLGAQEPSGTPPGVVAPAPATDSVAAFTLPSGTALRTGVTTYRLTLQRATGPTPLGTRTVEVGESEIGGSPAWLVTERRTGTAVPTVDSLWLSRTNLAPVRWIASIDRTQLAVSFGRDSIFGALQSYAGRSSFGAPMLPGVLVTPGMTERILEALPLQAGYRAAASLLLVDMGTPRALPAEIVVEREERVRTSGGEADCWLVVVRAGAMAERLWIDRSRRVVVRTEQTSASGTVVGEL